MSPVLIGLSVVLLGRTFGWPDVRYVSANVARGGTPPTEADLDLVRRANHLDQELYDHSCRLLDERMAAEPGFAGALEQFRQENARYARWGRLTYTLPSRIKRRLAPAVRHKTP